MQYFVSFLVILVWSLVISVILAVALGMAIWALDKMMMEVKSLRHVMKKPIAAGIVLGAFILAVGMVLASGLFR